MKVRELDTEGKKDWLDLESGDVALDEEGDFILRTGSRYVSLNDPDDEWSLEMRPPVEIVKVYTKGTRLEIIV